MAQTTLEWCLWNVGLENSSPLNKDAFFDERLCYSNSEMIKRNTSGHLRTLFYFYRRCLLDKDFSSFIPEAAKE